LIREIYDTMSIEEEAFRFHVELLSPTEDWAYIRPGRAYLWRVQ
jgi:hypothetical protein